MSNVSTSDRKEVMARYSVCIRVCKLYVCMYVCKKAHTPMSVWIHLPLEVDLETLFSYFSLYTLPSCLLACFLSPPKHAGRAVYSLVSCSSYSELVTSLPF